MFPHHGIMRLKLSMAVIAVVVAVYTLRLLFSDDGDAVMTSRMWNAELAELNATSKIVISNISSKVTLLRGDEDSKKATHGQDAWTIAELGGFPVDPRKMELLSYVMVTLRQYISSPRYISSEDISAETEVTGVCGRDIVTLAFFRDGSKGRDEMPYRVIHFKELPDVQKSHVVPKLGMPSQGTPSAESGKNGVNSVETISVLFANGALMGANGDRSQGLCLQETISGKTRSLLIDKFPVLSAEPGSWRRPFIINLLRSEVVRIVKFRIVNSGTDGYGPDSRADRTLVWQLEKQGKAAETVRWMLSDGEGTVEVAQGLRSPLNQVLSGLENLEFEKVYNRSEFESRVSDNSAPGKMCNLFDEVIRYESASGNIFEIENCISPELNNEGTIRVYWHQSPLTDGEGEGSSEPSRISRKNDLADEGFYSHWIFQISRRKLDIFRMDRKSLLTDY